MWAIQLLLFLNEHLPHWCKAHKQLPWPPHAVPCCLNTKITAGTHGGPRRRLLIAERLLTHSRTLEVEVFPHLFSQCSEQNWQKKKKIYLSIWDCVLAAWVVYLQHNVLSLRSKSRGTLQNKHNLAGWKEASRRQYEASVLEFIEASVQNDFCFFFSFFWLNTFGCNSS